jgi:hypothetical protein
MRKNKTTTENTKDTETDGKEMVQIQTRESPFLPASVSSVSSVVNPQGGSS